MNNIHYKSELLYSTYMTLHELWIQQVHPSWLPLGELLRENNLFPQIEYTNTVYPRVEHVFRAFTLTSLDNLRVVLLGQDPYHHTNNDDKPCATGLSFSIGEDHAIPSSLNNMNRNWIKYKHITDKITDLTVLAEQGVLLLNTSLTVEKAKPNSHAKLWIKMTDYIIKYIGLSKPKLVFVLFGLPALNKKKLLGESHKFVISSHPSGLSCNTKLREYPAFMDLDHLTIINSYLEKDIRLTK